MSKKKLSPAIQAKQAALDCVYNELLAAIELSSNTGKFTVKRSIPADIPDDVHNLILNGLRSSGFKAEVTDSNDFNDEVTISWE